MSTRLSTLLAAALCAAPLLLAAGCRKDKDDEDKKKAATAAAEKSASSDDDKSRTKGKEKEQTNFDVATEEDYEAKVEQEITAESDFKKELDLLEQQIAK